MTSDQTSQTGSERHLLEATLDRNRDAVLAALSGLPDSAARVQLVPSLTTPLSLIKHCAAAERIWFQRTLAGLPEYRCDGYAVGDDKSWYLDDSDTFDSVIAEYGRARTLSDDIAARYSLDYRARHYRRGHASLRWIYLHMIEEFARHAGHADIISEQIRDTTERDGGAPEFSG
ncbi:DinB family protein [Gordonia sp. MP11Mi]|uniref:DUF664 domain-containing protein n=1 Tax=Gordonia sp. MP11Mi TaxID=3022769 RepID=A0AA97GV93_9ACTN